MSVTIKSRAIAWRSKIWLFLNSAFGLWLLSSIALGGGTWLFQQWRDSVQKADAAQQRIERLQFEVAGRTSQYLSWFAANCAKRNYKDKYEFRDGVTSAMIVQSIKDYGDLPRRKLTAIQEILPDFKDRSLISIFAELKILNDKEKVAHGLNERSDHEADDLTEETFQKLPMLERRGSTYIRAMRYLVTEVNDIPQSITYDEFKKRFSTVFLYPEMQDFHFPYTDCFDC